MIPCLAKDEPEDFDLSVRQPGNLFLATTPNPIDKEWKGKEYWQKSLANLRDLNNKLCAYCSTWIPHSTGSHSVDHFIPKSINPSLAYEWTNFRYVSTRFNSRKGLKKIVDPQSMAFNWFVIDFNNFFIKPNFQLLTDDQLALAQNTITILKFNEDEELINERLFYYQDFMTNHISFDYLIRKAPFIAGEMIRQNLFVN